MYLDILFELYKELYKLYTYTLIFRILGFCVLYILYTVITLFKL